MYKKSRLVPVGPNEARYAFVAQVVVAVLHRDLQDVPEPVELSVKFSADDVIESLSDQKDQLEGN